MSTRSGKRIHNSPEPGLKVKEVKTDRKTRSQKQKEYSGNIEDFPKKKHYVLRQLSDEDNSSDTNSQLQKTRTRKSCRTTLKEQNLIAEPDCNVTKSLKSTRRNKKIENEIPLELPQKSNKAKKKKNVSIDNTIDNETLKNKKIFKKKTSSGSLVIEDLNDTKISANKDNVSVVSYHSAAGSIICSPESDFNVVSKTINKNVVVDHGIFDTFTVNSQGLDEQVTKKFSKKKLSKSNDVSAKSPNNNEVIIKNNDRLSQTNDNLDVFENLERKSILSFKNSTFNDVSEGNILNGIFDISLSNKNNERRSSLIIFDKSVDPNSLQKLNGSFKCLNGTFNKSTDFDISTKQNNENKEEITFEKGTIKNKTSNRRDTGIINTTFDKDVSKNNTTFEKDLENVKSKHNTLHNKDKSIINNTFDKETNMNMNTSLTNFKRKYIKNNTPIKGGSTADNTTFNKQTSANATFEKDTSYKISTVIIKDKIEKKSLTIKSNTNTPILKEASNNETLNKKNTSQSDTPMSNTTKIDLTRGIDTVDTDTIVAKKFNVTFENDDSSQVNDYMDKGQIINIETKLNTTHDKVTTFEEALENLNTMQQESANASKSSVISSDASNITEDKSLSRISIISDESRNENIMNSTPVLIESSMEESLIATKNEPSPSDTGVTNSICNVVQVKLTPVREKSSGDPKTPRLQREGTYTKEDTPEKTPHFNSSTSPGHTPFPSSKNSSTKKRNLNLTRSLEKSRRPSVAELPRTTRVMFCSPVNTPMILNQTKKTLIKSSLKGSNKSFVYDESVTGTVRSSRKRSLTQSDAEDIQIKRKRLASERLSSTDRLSRSRTSSASGKIQNTPSKNTPSKTKPEEKVPRKKLPNFAALHQKEFAKMESLDECQERKAKRAKQLLAAAAAAANAAKDKDVLAETTNPNVNKKRLPTLDSLNPGYTRFGFKMGTTNVNPFTSKPDSNMSLNITNPFANTKKINAATSFKALKPKENILNRQATLPSLTGCTVRKELAKQSVMREKTKAARSNVTRNENRTIIKGVRTNRRFDLQMQLRNIN